MPISLAEVAEVVKKHGRDPPCDFEGRSLAILACLFGVFGVADWGGGSHFMIHKHLSPGKYTLLVRRNWCYTSKCFFVDAPAA